MAHYKHPQYPKFWYIRGTHPSTGKRYLKSTGIPIGKNLTLVYTYEQQYLAALEKRAREGASGPSGAPLDASTMPMCLESLRLLHREKLAGKTRHKDTLKNYDRHWRYLAEHFDGIESFRYAHQLQTFAAHRLQTVAPPTVRKDIDVLLGAYSYARERGMPLPPKPARPDMGEKSHQEGPNKGQYLEPELFREFMRRLRIRRNGQANADRLALCLLTGLRWGETNRLQNCRQEAPQCGFPGLRMILVVLGKNKTYRKIPLGPQGYAAFQRSVGFFPKKSLNQFRKLSQEMGLPATLKLRDARTTFANLLASLNVDVPAIDKVMGHTRGMPSVYQRAYEERLALVSSTIEKAVFGEPFGKQVVSSDLGPS